MSEQDQAAPPPEPRISTGTEALDVMLHGGFMTRRPYLVVGPSGTGKTTLALQFLCDGIRRGERCLIVTLEEPPNEMRMNHRSMLPDLDQVYVFDAIPDVMRYERAPFKDIAAVRQAIPFSQVPMQIRKTPELSSVEVTFTALEQTLKMEMAKRNFHRIVIDSLTALQYFCMKGFDETLGAQTFLRFLSDLHVTTVLTVEAPLEDSETPERLLARGEVRLFRWEHDSRTVRAIGVEKFRGSEHDGRLHPYRIAPNGLDINLALTISRDTQELLPSTLEGAGSRTERAEPPEIFATSLSSLEQDSRDLIAVGVDVGGIRSTVLEALAASERSTPEEVARIIARARGRVLEIVSRLGETAPPDGSEKEPPEMRRLRARLAAARMGIPPSGPPDLATLRPMLEDVLDALEPAGAGPRPGKPTPSEAPVSPAPSAPSPPTAPAVTSAPAGPAPPRITPGPPTATSRAPAPTAVTEQPPARTPAQTPPSDLPQAVDAPTVFPEPPRATEPSQPAPPEPSGPARTAPSPVRPTREPPIAPPGIVPAASSKVLPPPPGHRPDSRAAGAPPSIARTTSADSARSSPPPLPSPGTAEPPRESPPPAPSRSERARAISPPRAVKASPAPAHAPTAPGAPVAAPDAVASGATPAPKRRRKAAGSPAPAAPRKRAGRAAKSVGDALPSAPTVVPDLAPPVVPAAGPERPPTPSSSQPLPVATPSPAPVVPAVALARPKRRAPRRKAPPVTAAEQGSPPPEEARVENESATSDPPAPGSPTDTESPPDGA